MLATPDGASCLYVSAAYGQVEVAKVLLGIGGRDMAMLTMYDEFHTARESKCTDLLGGGEGDGASGAGSAAATTVDFLAAPSVEQFRERVGKLRRVPFVKHPPERLPTMDSYYSQRAASSSAAEGGASPAEGGYQLCFPRIYAHGCVPKVNQSAVDRHHTCA